MSNAEMKLLVLGIGNPLMGDEGVGPRVVEYLLSEYAFPDNVEVVDAGTMGFTMLNIFEGVDLAVVVDAVQGTGHEPGTILLLDPDSLAPNQIMHSLHDARLPDVLDAAKLMGMEPEVMCVAVQIGDIEHWQLELSPIAATAVPNAAQAVVGLLAERGVVARRREVSSIADEAVADAGTPRSDGSAEGDRAASEADRAVKILRSLRTKDDVDA